MILRDGRAAQRAAALAEALLAEGILQESDWQGELAPSIGYGLTRWVFELLGGEDLERIAWGLFWTDDVRVAAPNMDTRLWYQAGKDRDPHEPVGLLALQSVPPEYDRYPEERDVMVGWTVRELEAARPGLGFQVLFLLQEVLPWVLAVGCPFWALREAHKYDHFWKAAAGKLPRGATELRYDELPYNVIPPNHGVTAEQFLAVIPREACEGEYRPGVIKEALRHRQALPDPLRAIVELAAEVETYRRMPRDAYRWDTHLLCTGSRSHFMFERGVANVEIPFALRWSADDAMPRFVEEYHRTIRKNDDSTNLIWSKGWQMTNPAGLRKAVRHFRQAVTLALRACQLAERMHRVWFHDEEEAPCH